MNSDKLRRKKIPHEYDFRSELARVDAQDNPENSGRIEMIESLMESIKQMLIDADIDIEEAKVKPVAWQSDTAEFAGRIKIDGYEITIRERSN